MPNDTLFPAAAQLLGKAGTDVQANADRSQQNNNLGVETAEGAGLASADAQAKQQKKQQFDAAQAALDRQANMVQVTPQIALGLVKNTGNKEWMKSVGQPIRADVLMSFLRTGINEKIAGKEYKTIKDGKEYTIANDIDENGDIQPRIVTVGDAPVTKTGADTDKAKADRLSREKIAAEKAAADKAKSSKSGGEPAEDKEFEKTYRGYLKDTEGMNGMLLQQMAKKDPKQSQDMQAKMDFIQKNQDRFNKLQGTQGEKGGAAPQKFDSADAVRAAFKAGTITRDAAKKILADQFGMK
jgi:hypothetical protein